jgi:hypothetical protein
MNDENDNKNRLYLNDPSATSLCASQEDDIAMMHCHLHVGPDGLRSSAFVYHALDVCHVLLRCQKWSR